MKFIDEVEILVGSGKGGPGCVSFRRESKVPRGGPDGGDGGRGGHIIFKVNKGLNTLLNFKFKQKFMAKNGEQGRGAHQSGAQGPDLILEVPSGTLILDENNYVIKDLTEGEFLFLEGGLGGKGNSFYKSSTNQAPQVAQHGLPGQTQKVKLELKLIADVGLVGFPNAGKSTLISHVSKARPKIADYPFTTLKPNLGVVPFGESSFVIADIPGIIEGAHKGVGLGLQFLKHIERTKMFLYVLDVGEMNTNNPVKEYEILKNEIRQFVASNKDKVSRDFTHLPPLTERPFLVALNKIDTCSEDRIEAIQHEFQNMGVSTHAISAVTGENLKELVYKIGGMVFGK